MDSRRALDRQRELRENFTGTIFDDEARR